MMFTLSAGNNSVMSPRPRKKIHVFPLTYSKILGSVGRENILFLKIFLASFYRGYILTLIVLVKKLQKKL